MAVNESDVNQLVSMGFSAAQSREALTVSNGNLEMAVNYLLSGDMPAVAAATATSAGPSNSSAASASASAPSNTSASMMGKKETSSMETIAKGLFTCDMNQYNFNNGRSACTCIALTAAGAFLSNPSIQPDFLQQMLTDGVQNYERLSSSSSNVEHLSAEEVLQKDPNGTIFGLELVGGIRQGVLSHDPYHPLGLSAILHGLRQESPSLLVRQGSNNNNNDDWLAILITKTPETVLVCFPPPSMSPSSYWLIDSHPRPQLGVENAYAKLHPNLDSLILSLQAIFPCTDLGPDIPEMMAMMYNGFDLYPLRRKQS